MSSMPMASHDIYHIMVPDIMVQPDLGCTLEAGGMVHQTNDNKFRNLFCLVLLLSLSPLSSAFWPLRSALCALPSRLWLRPMAFLRSGQNRPPFASHDIYHITP